MEAIVPFFVWREYASQAAANRRRGPRFENQVSVYFILRRYVVGWAEYVCQRRDDMLLLDSCFSEWFGQYYQNSI